MKVEPRRRVPGIPGGTVERWDADLGAEALRRLPPGERRQRIVASLQRKVERAEAAATGMRQGDTPPGIPTDKAGLRRWHDPALGLWCWSDRVVDGDRGPHGDLVRRWRSAIEAIRVRSRGGRRAFLDEIRLRDRRIADLELQVLGLLDERRALREAADARRVRK
jgi:hypothetical protein